MTETIQIQVSKAMMDELLTATKQIMLMYSSLNNSDLVKSLEWQYKDNLFILLAFDYFKYVDTGRKPRARKVPIQALIKWMQKKGIRPTGKQTFTQVAFAIQTAIFKAGIRPKPYTQLIIGSTIEYLSEELAVNLSVQIADAISEELTMTLGVN